MRSRHDTRLASLRLTTDLPHVSPPSSEAAPEANGPTGPLFRSRRNAVTGPLVMLATIAVLELVSHTPVSLSNPVPVGLLALVYATFRSGIAGGIVSAVLFLVYDLRFLAEPGTFFRYADGNVRRLVVLAAVMPAIVFLVGRFRRQAERLVEDRTELLKQLVHAEEQERRRLSRRLHDQMGQHLAALTIGLKRLEPAAATAPEALERLDDLRALVDRIDQEVRRIALDLRPAVLDDLGLNDALESCVHEWSERSGVKADFQGVGLAGRAVSAPVETALYRVVQESLTNVLKHARASQVSVVAQERDGEVLLIVEDDGAGFDGEAVRSRPDRRARGLGLIGIREGVATLGGTVTIESAPSRGTTVFVRIPLPPEKERRNE
ncbi:MAG TPA: sensor histidine kinase [Thermoanaerobaculia bacterium]|nr:sensor histidine kinase [Thermoanaerobaculia bacterium]